MMTTIRPNTRANGNPTPRLTFYLALFIALVIAGILLLPSSSSSSSRGGGKDVRGDDVDAAGELMSPATVLKMKNRVPSTKVAEADGDGGSDERVKNKEELDEVDVDPLRIVEGSVTYDASERDGSGRSLPYYHCGPLPSHDDAGLTELILLHGAKFTKEDWKTSGILDMLCEINNEEDEGDLSIIALDLPVSADGGELGSAFDALVSSGILSGRPVTFVSPSASGLAIVSLGELASASGGGGGGEGNSLTKIVKAWIPVASPAILKASDTTLIQFKNAKIPILSIHGDKDEMGKKVTLRLTTVTGAEGVELAGGHPVYLDSPQEFVGEVMQFLDEMGL